MRNDDVIKFLILLETFFSWNMHLVSKIQNNVSFNSKSINNQVWYNSNLLLCIRAAHKSEVIRKGVNDPQVLT